VEPCTGRAGNAFSGLEYGLSGTLCASVGFHARTGGAVLLFAWLAYSLHGGGAFRATIVAFAVLIHHRWSARSAVLIRTVLGAGEA